MLICSSVKRPPALAEKPGMAVPGIPSCDDLVHRLLRNNRKVRGVIHRNGSPESFTIAMASPAIGIEKFREILEFRRRLPTIFFFRFTRRGRSRKGMPGRRKAESNIRCVAALGRSLILLLFFILLWHGVQAHSLTQRPALHGFDFLGLEDHITADQPERDLADHEPSPVNASREGGVNQVKGRINQSGPDERSDHSAEQPFQMRRKHRQKDGVEQSDENGESEMAQERDRQAGRAKVLAELPSLRWPETVHPRRPSG